MTPPPTPPPPPPAAVAAAAAATTTTNYYCCCYYNQLLRLLLLLLLALHHHLLEHSLHLEVLADAPIDARILPHRQLTLLVRGGHALPLTHGRQSVNQIDLHLHVEATEHHPRLALRGRRHMDMI